MAQSRVFPIPAHSGTASEISTIWIHHVQDIQDMIQHLGDSHSMHNSNLAKHGNEGDDPGNEQGETEKNNVYARETLRMLHNVVGIEPPDAATRGVWR